MKKYIGVVAILFAMSFVLLACSDDDEQNETGNSSDDSQPEQNNADENNDDAEKENESDATSDSEETDNYNSDDESSNNDGENNNQSEDNKGGALAEYSSEEIEYARVWLEVGENQAIDKLYAKQIPAGEPLNSDDEKSVDFPEDVVQLSGTRLVDGTVTYSSNRDGTINVYDVPNRWDGKNTTEDIYKQIIENTEEVAIDPGDDKKVNELIEKLEIN